MRRSIVSAMLIVMLMPAAGISGQSVDTLAAQRPDTGAGLACAATHASFGVQPGSSANVIERLGAGARVLDTTITLSIADRRWQRDNYEGGVALGTSSAIDAASSRARWSACAGVAVHLGQVTTALHNVYGTIHLRADLSALQRAGTAPAQPDSLMQRPLGTPPAVPPRR